MLAPLALLAILAPPPPAIASDDWLLRDCPGPEAPGLVARVDQLARCARSRALAALDAMAREDLVPLLPGVQLVRLGKPVNATKAPGLARPLGRIRANDERPEAGEGWQEQLATRVSRILRSHAIKVDPDQLQQPRSRQARDVTEIEPRGRRKRRQMQMMPMVMMGVLLMSTVLIPMGFQFLAVLGGKALILAKMALMLSSIQGLKKIATSNVNYGLYHSPVPEWHERSDNLVQRQPPLAHPDQLHLV